MLHLYMFSPRSAAISSFRTLSSSAYIRVCKHIQHTHASASPLLTVLEDNQTAVTEDLHTTLSVGRPLPYTSKLT